MSGNNSEDMEVNSPAAELVENLKKEIDQEKAECRKAQESVDEYIHKISQLDRKIRDAEIHITKCKSKVLELEEECGKVDEKMTAIDWMREKATLVLKSDTLKRQIIEEDMKKMHETFVNMTTEEGTTSPKIDISERIDKRILELTKIRDAKKKKLIELKAARDKDAAKLNGVNAEIMAKKNRKNDIVLRLRKKLADSEAARTKVLEELNNVKKLQ